MSDLCIHRGSRIVQLPELADIPTPQATSSWRPVPHIDLVTGLQEGLDRAGVIHAARGVAIREAQYAVSPSGEKLFGVFKLDTPSDIPGAGWSMGFRNSHDKSLRISAIAGMNVFVCDNLAFSAKAIMFNRFHNPALSLRFEIERGIQTYFTSMRALEGDVTAARARVLDDDTAKRMMFDLFYEGVLSQTLFEPVARNYFRAEQLGYEDCAERNVWGIHNAASRAVKALSPMSSLNTTVKLGRILELARS